MNRKIDRIERTGIELQNIRIHRTGEEREQDDMYNSNNDRTVVEQNGRKGRNQDWSIKNVRAVKH